MKNFKNLTNVLAVINLIGSIVFIVLMFISINNKTEMWKTYLPIACILFFNAIAFAFISALEERVDIIEKSIEKPQKKVEKFEKPQTLFKIGEPIRQKNSSKTGIVKDVLENDEYSIEWDDKRNNFEIIKGKDLESYF